MADLDLRTRLEDGAFDQRLKDIYGSTAAVKAAKPKLVSLVEQFQAAQPLLKPSIYTAAGRSELGGNHTDHQGGKVLASAVNLEVNAVAGLDGSNTITVSSTQFPTDQIDLDDLEKKSEEEDTSAALIRGIAKAFQDRGAKLQGAQILTHSEVPKGSGLSSSAAFEVLIGNVFNHLFFDDQLSQVEIAQIGQFAENEYFGKPSGLMDQVASAVGGVVAIDFADPNNPVVERVDVDFSDEGYDLVIIDSGADHADLTDDYAAITEEMGAVANFFGKDRLADVDPEEFWQDLAAVRRAVSDRATLRAAHFFADTNRVTKQVEALRSNNFEQFLEQVRESGKSSAMFLQNLYSPASQDQSVTLAIALAQELAGERGAVRVHGGGFAGTVQAYVPVEQTQAFTAGVEDVLGQGSCFVLQPRPVGGALVAE